jgi:hypothetical protein
MAALRATEPAKIGEQQILDEANRRYPQESGTHRRAFIEGAGWGLNTRATEPAGAEALGQYAKLLEGLDDGASHRGYPEEFACDYGPWTKLCADAASAIRALRATEPAGAADQESESQYHDRTSLEVMQMRDKTNTASTARIAQLIYDMRGRAYPEIAQAIIDALRSPPSSDALPEHEFGLGDFDPDREGHLPPSPDAGAREANPRLEKLQERRNELLNDFGNGAWQDGLTRDRLARVEKEIAALSPPSAGMEGRREALAKQFDAILDERCIWDDVHPALRSEILENLVRVVVTLPRPARSPGENGGGV